MLSIMIGEAIDQAAVLQRPSAAADPGTATGQRPELAVFQAQRKLASAQQARMRTAYRTAGPEAVSGFRQVLEAMMDPEIRRHYKSLKD